MKEFDAPALENFIDPDVIDKIRSQSKPPMVKRKTIVSSKQEQTNAKDENKIRIEKMRQLYGLFQQCQEEDENK